ncbi:MAG: hypothetical protein EAZ95_19085 [Bacteroidetes bacterium]|nr:MAG: hypothetical protein EAZ95_19085 [Bacteroidota bacterium]
MKKNIFLALIGLFLNAPNVQAQLYGNCSMFLCSEKIKGEQGTNLINIFTGFNSNAVNTNNKFAIYTIFQGYETNKVHSHYARMVHVATGKIIDTTEKGTFTLKDIDDSLSHTLTWTLKFPQLGVYVITTYVDDKVAQKLYFDVGD